MLKLTRHLFTWEALPLYADYYERALYNHILSSQDPVSGGVTYYHTLHPGGAKHFHFPFRDNTCCVGTGYEIMLNMVRPSITGQPTGKDCT